MKGSKGNGLKVIAATIGVLVLIASQASYAAVVTHGYLTTDDTTNFITDTNTGRMYTRFDAFDMTYAETVTSIMLGGAYEGWSIATKAISDEFIAAALGPSPTPCDPMSLGNCLGVISNWADGDFGYSYDWSVDYYAYLGGDIEEPIGLAGIWTDALEVGAVYDLQAWAPISALDGYYQVNPINLLLYKNVPSPMPEVGSIYLLSFGLLGLIGVARRELKGDNLIDY